VGSRYELTRRFHEVLSREPGITCPYTPESNILCFRVEDRDQLELREEILADGRFHVSSTTIGGVRYLRLVLTSPDTGEETLEQLLDLLAATRRVPARA
jgi:L-2,4-diaminobutyrate decarboxylase